MLRRLLLPDEKSIGVYDPHSRLEGDYCSRLISLKETPATGFYFDLSGTSPNGDECTIFVGSPIADCSHWYHINNNDGTFRWLYPSDQSSPAFLGLYNSSSMKARAFRMLTRMAWSVGQKNMLVHGTLVIDEALVQKLAEKCGLESREKMTLFTGTRGATRKVVIEINNGKVIRGFIKIPVSAAACENIKNENDMLHSLKQYDFTTMSIPTVSPKVNGHARLSNVKPAIIIAADKINTIHLRAISELYSFNHAEERIQDSTAWQVITGHMEFLKHDLMFTNNLPEAKTKKIVRMLRKLYNSIPTIDKIPVSISHGDFTPWNMYCDEQRLFVYDWEMARSGMPMLFDLFHFTFQSTILSRRKSFREVEEGNRSWLANAHAVKLINKYAINTELHYRLYLLFTISYYIRQYLGEKELLMQSNWMLDAWSAALESRVAVANNSLR